VGEIKMFSAITIEMNGQELYVKHNLILTVEDGNICTSVRHIRPKVLRVWGYSQANK
jgi:hypothetical protein